MEDPAQRRSTSLLALVAGFLTLYFVWGSTYLGIKFAVETLPPLLMAGSRFLLAGAILYTALRMAGVPAPSRAQWKLGLWTGTLLLLGGNGLVTWGQQTVPSGRAALLVATTPLWMVLLAWVFYRGERPTGRVWFGMLLGFLGAALLALPADQPDRVAKAATPVEGNAWLGMVALLLAPVAWSVGSLESRVRRPAENPLMTSAMQMLAGGLAMLLVGTLLGEWPILASRTVSAKSIGAFFYLALFGGLVGFSTYAWLLRVASPTAVSTYAYVNPLVAVLLGWGIAGEVLDRNVLLAGSLIIGAVVLTTLPRGAKAEAGETAPRRGPAWLLSRLVPVQSISSKS